MSNRLLLAYALLGSTALAGCRYHPTPVQLQGAPSDIAAIAGTWAGEYSGTQSQRTGSISFTVKAGSDSAFGDILMMPAGGQQLIAVDANTTAHALHAAQPELLQITFVRVSGGYVEGALEPYIASDCRCAVTTVFHGSLNGNVISGDFVTRGELGLRQVGTWRVERK